MIKAIIVVATVVAMLLVSVVVKKIVTYRASVPVDENGVKVKSFGKDVKSWFVRHLPSKRRLIQIYAALLYNANIKGYITGKIYQSETTKYMCVPGLNCYSCPGAVGACPLGALQNALSDSETRAPYYVLGIIGLLGLMFARTVCGFLCPVGMCQELLYKVRTPKVRKSKATRVLSYFKYVLLALTVAVPIIYSALAMPLPFFCKYICPAGTFEGAILLLSNPANTNLFAQLGWQFTWKFGLLIAFIVASMFIFRFFCRFFCPLGAIYGFFNKFAFIGVSVDESDCTDCGLCVSHCKMDVKRVGDHECINCGECMSVCPTQAIKWKGSKIFLKGNEIKSSACETAHSAVAVETVQPTQTCETIQPTENTQTEQASKPEKKKRGKAFWLQLAAVAAALAVLVTALVYYNFIDVEKPPEQTPVETVITGYNVGDVAPDFTVERYGADGTFNLYANRGKLTVVNFWATWCVSCVEELPYFNELAANHPEIDVIAVHGKSTEDVEKYIVRKGWSDYSLQFVQDNLSGSKCLTFAMLGGTDTWPMTVIIDGEGKVVYNSTQSFKSYEQLEELVSGLL